MIGEFVFYSLLLGAVTFFAGYMGFKKNKGAGWLVTLALGALIVCFVFPSPVRAEQISDILNNFTLLLYKLAWGVSWVVPAVVLSKVLPDY